MRLNGLTRKAFLAVRLHSNSHLTFNHSHGRSMMLEWHANGKIRIVPFERCCKKCYIGCYIKSWRWKIKVRRKIFTFKTLIYDQRELDPFWSMIMRVRCILRFLLILLVSILFSISSRFLWLQIIAVYNEKNIEYSLG